LNELDARKPLMISISQRSGELRLYSLGIEFNNFKPGLKAVSSNASPS
jgi:hypothetical protein